MHLPENYAISRSRKSLDYYTCRYRFSLSKMGLAQARFVGVPHKPSNDIEQDKPQPLGLGGVEFPSILT
jgi:hypothetical protein